MSGWIYERARAERGPMGLMQASRHRHAHIHDRKQFGRVSASSRLIQGKVADMLTHRFRLPRLSPTAWA